MINKRRAYRWMMLVAALVMAVALGSVGRAAGAPYGVTAFDGQVSADAAGNPFTQAGGHPYSASTTIEFANADDPLHAKSWPNEPTKDVLVDLPPGLTGNPTAVAQCTATELANEGGPACPVASQVGVVAVQFAFGVPTASPGLANTIIKAAVYNMAPPPDVPARFGFKVLGVPVLLDAEVRSDSDYGVTIDGRDISEGLAVDGTQVTLWGVPADPSHDAQRSCPGQSPAVGGGPSCSSQAPLTPFLRNPTSCTPQGVGVLTGLRTDSWFHPGDFVQATFISHDPPGYSLTNPLLPAQWGPQDGPTGCDQVPFDASLQATPGSLGVPARAGQPSSFTVDVNIPQSDVPDAVDTGDLKSAVVTLPEGVRVSPSAADGLGGCSEAQIGLIGTGFPEPNPIHFDTSDPTCPDSSKVGTVSITTPLLEAPITGSIYLATPNQNPFGTLVAIYLVAKGPGFIVKLPGKIELDPVTGQITSTFDHNPQVPVSNVHLEFNGGPRASLVAPPTCGTYTTHTALTSWSGKTVESDSSFALSQDGHGAPCPPLGFKPTMTAGTDDPVAGSHSSFRLALNRSDQDQELRSLSIAMPPGLTARLKGVPLCSNVQAAAGTCGASSRIGSVTVAAGPGTNPFFIQDGRVNLAGAYKGAPFSLSIAVPAIAGPFNLGTVVVRAAIQVDKHTAALRVITDPFPTVLDGIPLQLRIVRTAIDRARFILNPTSCDARKITAQVGSTQGAVARLASRFQVGNCNALAFHPRMQLSVGSKGHTGLHAATPFSTTLTTGPGQSNLKSVSVTLPTTLNARLGVVNNACTMAQYDSGHCQKARTGSAVAVTPLLDHPLRGSAYFVKTGKQGALPNLVIALRGQVSFDLIGTITIPHGVNLATTFATIPDVPVTSFTLKLDGGSHGAVGAATNLCTAKAKRATAQISYDGQNGKVRRANQTLRTVGCKHKS